MVYDEKNRAVSDTPKLIFACSGAADVGRLADAAARTMTEEGLGSMFCLAGVGGRVGDIMARTATAAAILAIDGCSLECAKQCLEQAGFEGSAHLRLDELGLEKGESPFSEDTLRRIVAVGTRLLG